MSLSAARHVQLGQMQVFLRTAAPFSRIPKSLFVEMSDRNSGTQARPAAFVEVYERYTWPIA